LEKRIAVVMELEYEQNEKELKVGLLVTTPVESKSSYFEWKLRELIEKCLLYSAIEKSPQTDVWRPRYKDFTKNIRKR